MLRFFPPPPAGGFRGRLIAGLLLVGFLGASCDRPPTAPKAVAVATAPPIALVPLTNMVPIQAGSFMRIRYPVTLTYAFWISKCEVTQAEYQAVTGKNPSKFTGDLQRPVDKVSHMDAQAYCEAITRRERDARRLPVGLEYRLPTEAEWEYACRAGTTNRFSFGDDTTDAALYAWTDENSEASTHPIGLKRPNPWGLYDMHGNVWEWVHDWFAEYPAMALTNPAGPPTSKFKVFRGGGWNNEIQFARSGNRFMMSATNGIHFVGFRMALGPGRRLSQPGAAGEGARSTNREGVKP